MLPVVLCEAIKRGSSDDWNMLLTEYENRRNTTIVEERRAYVYALSCTRDEHLLKKYVNQWRPHRHTHLRPTSNFAYCDRCYRCVVCLSKRQKISIRFSFAYNSPVSLPDRVKICFTSVHHFLPKLCPKWPTPRWLCRQIAAEWLEIAKYYMAGLAIYILWR